METKIYDLIILGNGFQASLIFAQAVNKGLKVALASKGSALESLDLNHFQIVEPYSINLLKYKYLIKNLRKSFAHMLLATESEFVVEMNPIKKILLKLKAIFIRKNIIFKSNPGQFSIQYIQVSGYKFSIVRMTVALLKEAVKSGGSVFQHAKFAVEEIDENGYSTIILKQPVKDPVKISVKNILSFYEENPIKKSAPESSILHSNHQIYFFTYPAKGLNIQKNIIYEDKEKKIFIVPWFDIIYFDCRVKGVVPLVPEEMINFIIQKLLNFKLDKSLIHPWENNSIRTLYQNKFWIYFYTGKKQILLKYRPLLEWFDYSNKICNQLINETTKVCKTDSLIGKTIFSGSDLPDISNPLRIMEYADELYDLAKQIMPNPIKFKKLFYTYGTDIEIIIDMAYEFWNKTKNTDEAWEKAELWYAMNHEFCENESDFYNQRI
ncbi:MAG: hypothetical protein U0W24_07645 [Bacteroidales bacterium]